MTAAPDPQTPPPPAGQDVAARQVGEVDALAVLADAAARVVEKRPQVPVRQLTAGKQPCDCNLSIVRSCVVCGGCFWHLAVGFTGQRGLWASSGGMYWYCSEECGESRPAS